MTLAYLEAAPLLALLEQVGNGKRGRLPRGTPKSIRDILVTRSLVTPPDYDGWSTADLTPAGQELARALASNPPIPPLGLTHDQCRALGSLRRQEIADKQGGRGIPRERHAASSHEWRDLESRRLVILGKRPKPGHAGSAALTPRGRDLADDLLGEAGGRANDCAAPTAAMCEGMC